MEPTKEARIKELGDIFYLDKPFDKALSIFKQNHIKAPITAREFAYARIQAGASHSLCQLTSYIREGDVYFPKEENKIILTRDSIILKMPKQAVNSHRNDVEFVVSEKYAQEIMDKVSSNDPSVFVLKSTEPIPTTRFNENELTNWLFRKQAGDYGLFLIDNNIQEMPLYFYNQNYINHQYHPYANQLWLGRFDQQSGLSGRNWYLDNDSRVRGVFKKSPERARKIFSTSKITQPKQLYNQKELTNALRIARGVKSTKLPACNLEKVVSFLDRLNKK